MEVINQLAKDKRQVVTIWNVYEIQKKHKDMLANSVPYPQRVLMETVFAAKFDLTVGEITSIINDDLDEIIKILKRK